MSFRIESRNELYVRRSRMDRSSTIEDFLDTLSKYGQLVSLNAIVGNSLTKCIWMSRDQMHLLEIS
jgi:hypothetical protein